MSVAQARLATRHTDAIAETVLFTRAEDGAQLSVLMIRGRHTPQRQALADGRVTFDEKPQDWLVDPDLINFGAGVYTPRRGDRIQDEANVIYELLDRDFEMAQRRSDPYGHLLRLRTIQTT